VHRKSWELRTGHEQPADSCA